MPVSLTNIKGLEHPFFLDVIVKDDIVDICIDNRHTLFHYRPYDFSRGDRLFIFVREGTVTFKDIKVQPLKD